VKLFGTDLEVLKPQADRIAALMGGISGAEGVKVEQISGAAQVRIVVDRKASARYRPRTYIRGGRDKFSDDRP
jgi:cobalt-zinc-cadmium resistance protein CzcA